MKEKAAIAGLILFLVCSAAHAEKFYYMPDQKKLLKGQAMDGNAVQYTGPQMIIRAEILDNSSRARFLASRIGRSIDPFAIEKNSNDFFLTILLQMENKTPGRMYFNPSTTVLHARQWFHTPLGYSMLFSYLDNLIKNQKGMVALMGCVYDSPVFLDQGERVSKLLVFSDIITKRAPQLTLEVPNLGFGLDEPAGRQTSAEMSFRFKRFKNKNTGKDR